MNQVEIKAVIDASNPTHVDALSQFLNSIGGNANQTKSAPVEEKKETSKKETSKKETPKKEAPTPIEEKKEQPAPIEKKKETPTTSIKIEDVRALLAKKVDAHRAEVKSKLTALGANNVSSLKTENYQEFIDFLNGLS